MKKIMTFVIPIITFFIGIIGTVVVYKFIPSKSETVIKNVSELNITESDTIRESVNKVYNAVVTVQAYSNGVIKSLGTGFVYKTDADYGYILTNNHVISGSKKFTITNNDGKVGDAEVLGSDEYVDIAVLRVELEYVMEVAEFGDSTQLEIGDTVFTVGTPVSISYAGTVTKGIVSGKERTVPVTLDSGGQFMMDVIQTNAAINPGNSGGPLCNINGQIIGINTLKLVENEIEGMGFAIPIEMVTSVLDRLEKGEKIDRPLLGVTLTDTTNSYYLARSGIYLDSSITNGTVIMGIEENSTASQAGLKKGDVILKINGVDVLTTAHFRYLLYKYSVGDTITIEYYSDKETKTIDIKLDNGI